MLHEIELNTCTLPLSLDICVGLLDVMPIAIERSVGLMYETTDVFLLGPVMCKIDRMVARTALLGSNFVLCAMSIDRALAIGKPLLRYGKGKYLYLIFRYIEDNHN